MKRGCCSKNLRREDRCAGLFLGLALLITVELEDVIRHFVGVSGSNCGARDVQGFSQAAPSQLKRKY